MLVRIFSEFIGQNSRCVVAYNADFLIADQRPENIENPIKTQACQFFIADIIGIKYDGLVFLALL